ncbi:MAG: hypothetical protein LBJ89_00350 [Holosporales bacterium]|jgi:hypothetical protein|nr:hypothetical protein [Holosporales bacterium]
MKVNIKMAAILSILGTAVGNYAAHSSKSFTIRRSNSDPALFDNSELDKILLKNKKKEALIEYMRKVKIDTIQKKSTDSLQDALALKPIPEHSFYEIFASESPFFSLSLAEFYCAQLCR